MHDKLRSYIRTAVPMVLGHAAAWIVAWLATNVGVTVDSVWVVEVLAVSLTVILYVAGRRLETSRLSWARGIGRFVLALGADLGQPIYLRKTSPQRAAAMATLGEMAYTAYGERTGWRTYAGGPMHPWNELPARVRAAWADAATAARTAL